MTVGYGCAPFGGLLWQPAGFDFTW